MSTQGFFVPYMAHNIIDPQKGNRPSSALASMTKISCNYFLKLLPEIYIYDSTPYETPKSERPTQTCICLINRIMKSSIRKTYIENEKEPEVNKKKNRNIYFCVPYPRYFFTSIHRVINIQKNI